MGKASRNRFIRSPEHCLVEKYTRVTRLHRSMMEHRLDGTGIYRGQHQILMSVSNDLNVSQRELARMHDVSEVIIVISLEKLERRGYIERLVDQENSRYGQICIMDKGRKVVGGSVKIFKQMKSRMFEGFSENNMKVLGQLLDQIYGNLDREFTDRARREESQVRQYRKYIRPYLGAFVLGPLLTLTEVAGEIMLPKLMSMIINNGVVQRNVQYILSVRGLMILATLTMAIRGIGGTYFSVKIAVSSTSDLRDDLFSRVQEFSFKNIDSYSTGSLVIRLTSGTQQIQNVLIVRLRTAMRAPGMFMGVLIMAFMMSARLAAVILAIVPLLAAAVAVILRTAFPRFTTMQRRLGQLNSGIQETLTNIWVIKSFVREEFEEEKFKDMNQDSKNSSLDAMKIVIVTMPVMTPAMNITTLAMVWYRDNIIITGNMPTEDLTVFTTYIVQIPVSPIIFSVVLLQFSRAAASIRRIGEAMDTEIDLIDRDASRENLAVLRGKVESKHVSFNYADNRDEMILEDINFAAESGQIIGTIGSTGNGKTTPVQMTPRFYDTAKGQVLMDGVDVREYSLKNLREGVGMVLQKNMLFSGTMGEDLRWGKEDASMDKIRGMVQSTQVDSFVTFFASGCDTDMGQGGVNVSGSRKQRLCITRTLLGRPKVLILDDGTSAVDTVTKARIRQCFSTNFKGVTKIIITQHIRSVEKADRILVLDEGRLIGQGTHEQLMEGCKVYREIYYSQRDRKKTAIS